MQNKSPPLILTFGASDPVGATGIQADLASFAAIGCHGLSALTAVLVGDTSEFDDIHPLDADLVDEQARTVLEDMVISAIKIGQVGSAENVTAIAEIVSVNIQRKLAPPRSRDAAIRAPPRPRTRASSPRSARAGRTRARR